MSLLKMLLESQNGQGLGQLARQFGIDDDQAGALAGMLAPAIATGAKKRAERGGLETVLGQMFGEQEAAYFDEPARAAEPEARQQGEAFLEQIFGSGDAARQLSAEASSRSGVSQQTVEQFLPAIAAMLKGGMQRNMPDDTLRGMMQQGQSGSGGGLGGLLSGLFGGGGRSGGSGGGGALDTLNRMLDADGDGSALDDVLERFMR